MTDPLQMTILLVEDDDVAAESVVRSLTRAGLTIPVVWAEDGEIALQVLRGRDPNRHAPRPRVVLLDLNMPRMNGLEFLRELREDPDLRALTVVVLTTSSDERDKIEAYNLNVAGYILKPVTFSAFVEAMSALNKYWSINELL